jgi:WD40 repeat protein
MSYYSRMLPELKYDVFLSHNSKDKPQVAALARHLREEHGLRPFLDEWHLVPGEASQPALEEALRASRCVAVFVGPEGIGPWQNEEMRAAITRAVRTRDDYRVIPVLLPGADQAALEGFLGERTWIDFGPGIDDALALTRLVAGVRGEAVEGGGYELPDEPAPYRGLRPYEAEHGALFFGREAEIGSLVRRLKNDPVVVVVGASGSGKSSLARAGLLPALAAGRIPGAAGWTRLVCRPGDDVLRSVAEQVATLVPAAERLGVADQVEARMLDRDDGLRTGITTYLAGSGSAAFLLVDQLEEIFTLCTSEQETCARRVERLAVNLLDAARAKSRRVRLALTLRADFLDRCLACAPLRDLLQDHQFLLGPLAESDSRDVIARPAAAVGAFLEKGLVARILGDTRANPGALPLLQHALHELWLHRRGPWLTNDAYEERGGVRGALERRADQTYEALDPAARVIARGVFLRLVTLGEGVGDTGRRAPREELYTEGVSRSAVDAVIDALANEQARLVVADERTVEVTHEALIRYWPTLRGWLEEDREALRLHRRLTESAGEWRDRQRDALYLYRAGRLQDAEEWASEHASALNALEREFLDASTALRSRERKERERQRRLEVEMAQRLAETERQHAAESRRRLAESYWAGAAIARENGDGLEAAHLLAAGAAVESHPGRVDNFVLGVREYTRERRLEAMTEAFEAAALLGRGESMAEPPYARFSPSERYFLTCLPGDGTVQRGSGEVRIWRSADGEPLGPALRHTYWVQGYRLSAREDRLLTWGGQLVGSDFGYAFGEVGEAFVWNVAEGMPLGSVMRHEGPVYGAAFVRDEREVLTWGRDGTVRRWSVGHGEPVAAELRHDTPVAYAKLLADEGVVLTVDVMGVLRRWGLDVDAGARGPLESAPEGGGSDVERSADALRGLLAAGFEFTGWEHDETAQLWLRDPADGARFRILSVLDARRALEVSLDRVLEDVLPEPGEVYSVWVTPGGGPALVFGKDDSVRILNRNAELDLEERLAGVSPFRSVLSESGEYLASWEDRTATIWSTARAKPPFATLEHAARIEGVALSPDGARAFTWDDAGRLYVWGTHTGEQELGPLEHESPVDNVCVSAREGDRVLACGKDGATRLWRIRGRSSSARSLGTGGRVIGARETRNGERLLTWGDAPDKCTALRLWRLDDGRPVGAPMAHGAGINFVSDGSPDAGARFSDDERHVLSWASDGKVRLWHAGDGSPAAPAMRHDDKVYGAVFSRDGRSILSWSRLDDTARLWSVADGCERIPPLRHEGHLNGACFDTEQARILTWGDYGTARLWSAATGEPVVDPLVHEGEVLGARFSHDSSLVLTRTRSRDKHSGVARLWRSADGQPVGAPMRHDEPVGSAVFNADESLVVTCSAFFSGWGREAGAARIWQAATGDPLGPALVHGAGVLGARLLAGETRLLTWSRDNTARLWAVGSGAPIGGLMRHLGAVRGAAVTDDESSILTWSEDGTARTWSAIDAKPLCRPMPHGGPVLGATFCMQDQRILTWSAGGARLWRTDDGRLVIAPLPATGAGSLLGAYLCRRETRLLLRGRFGAVLWKLDVAGEAAPEHLALEVEVCTGTAMDEYGNLRHLTRGEWMQRRARLRAIAAASPDTNARN